MPRNRQRAAGRPLPEEATRLSDADLLAKLQAFGITLDRSSLAGLCDQAISAKQIADALVEHGIPIQPREAGYRDWIWFCVATLWQRWFPDVPSFEALDGKMQSGYDLVAARNVTAACRLWLDAWRDVLVLLDKAGIRSIADFDARFGGMQALFNWIQDFEAELWNAGLEDPQFLTSRITVCEEGLRRFPTDDELLTENQRRALAESYFALGEVDKADALYREWLSADPRWGWGWIGWADNYWVVREDRQDVTRVEQILREGLATSGVRDRVDLLHRLADLCDEQGRHSEAKEFRRQIKIAGDAMEATVDVTPSGPMDRQKATITFGDEGVPLSDLPKITGALRNSPAPVNWHRIGRNDPCPCGSGKKFKKCCGRTP